MSKDLMELIGGCPVYETDVLEPKGQGVIEEYRELGFMKATEEPYQKNLEISKRQRIYEFEYRVITTEAIRKFLQRKVTLYDKEHKPKAKKETPFFAITHTVRDLLTNGDFVHIPLREPEEPQPSDVFDTKALDMMRAGLMRSAGITERLSGISENLRSAQEGLAIHRQETVMRKIEERDWRRKREAQIHQMVACDPIPFHAPWSNSGDSCSIYERTCDYDKSDPETIGRFEWKEERVEDYDGLPPAPVIETFKEHKARKVFDYFTIASVNSVPDPLLLGRIDGDDDNRWFIAQWGEDVCLDDVIK